MNPPKPTTAFSHKATIASFIMAVSVMYIHANNLVYYGLTTETGGAAGLAVRFCSGLVGSMAVPFFFMLSAYWLFRMDISGATVRDTLAGKLRRKLRTVVLPYLLWNAFGTVFYMAITHVPALAAMMNNGEAIPVTPGNLLVGVFLYKYYYTFWYLKDLIVMTALSPLLVPVLRRRWSTALVWAAVLAVNFLPIDLKIVQSPSLVSFYLGAYLAVYHRDMFEETGRADKRFVLLFAAFCIVRWLNVPVLADVCLWLSPLALWKFLDAVLPQRLLAAEPCWFVRQSFFLYAVHAIPITVVQHLFVRQGAGIAWVAVSYLLTPVVMLGIAYAAARLLNGVAPRFYALICGGRSEQRC